MGGVFPVTFTAGSRMAMVFISTTSDETAEMSEEFKVVIQVPDDEDLVMPGDPDTAVVTITDDDGVCVCVCVCVCVFVCVCVCVCVCV